MRATLIVLALVALSAVDAAVLVRFINTVPQLKNIVPYATSPTNAYEPATSPNPAVDRVGLQYYPSQSSKTVVWTEIAAGDITGTAPYTWTFAMPPLRGAHKINAPAATYVDTVATYLTEQNTANFASTQHPSVMSTYEQSSLKADGVSGYMSFAPGTYRMSPYAVLGIAAGGVTNTQSTYDFADTQLTFQDNMVYTIVAYGNGALSATPVTSGNSVRLALITESVAPADFGKAAVRFFHGIERSSTVSISVSMGSTQVASNVAFGQVSSYTQIKATKSVHFFVSRSDSPAKDETDITQVHDLRAGMRATLFCAVNNFEAPIVFCRMIPSRVVAYVRLAHDAADKQQLVQSRFGPQTLASTKLSLWASFEYPRPWQTQPWTQDMGQVSVTGHPLTTQGLYPVVQDVAANTISGYGEVHVPLPIMDFAVRTIIGFSTTPYTSAGGSTTGFNAGASNRGASPTVVAPAPATPIDPWFYYAPMFKRVSFVIKTDGYATLTGDAAAGALSFGGGVVAGGNTYHRGYFSTDSHNLANSLLTDIYVEPGEFYTIFAQGNNRATHLAKLQSNGMVRIFLRRDLSIDAVHDLPADQGSVSFVPFGFRINGVAGTNQAFTNVKVTGSGTGATSTIRTWTNTVTEVRSGDIATVFAAVGATPAGWIDSNRPLLLAAGTYTYSQDPAVNTCDGHLPSGTVTITNGVRAEVFVFNTEACVRLGGTATGQLVPVVTTAQSAQASGHAPTVATTGSRRAERDIPFYTQSAASTLSASSLFIAALIAMALALL